MNLIADDLTIYDSIIVGDGPEALDTALQLGRSRDRVLLLDDDCSAAMSHEPGMPHGEMVELERRRRFQQLLPYDVTVQACHVARIERHLPDLFAVTSKNRMWFGRKVVIATGDSERELPGIIAHLDGEVCCSPFRGGWEVRGQASIGELT